MALSDYLENNLIDFLYRAQTFTPSSSRYHSLYTAAPGDTGGGTETSYTGYARVAVVCGLTTYLSTQGNTSASTGTTGQTSNAAAITFGAPTSGPATLTHTGTHSASTAGNLYTYGALTASRTINNGDAAPSFAIGAYTDTYD